MHRRLSTFDSVIEELGGLEGVAKIVKRSKAAICNARRFRGTFPRGWVFDMRGALEKRGATAPISLWGFDERDAA